MFRANITLELESFDYISNKPNQLKIDFVSFILAVSASRCS